ncbi:MAG TPA: hypothetical protein VGH38_23150 [Bryobacteraceae bacterium]
MNAILFLALFTLAGLATVFVVWGRRQLGQGDRMSTALQRAVRQDLARAETLQRWTPYRPAAAAASRTADV